MNSIRYGDVRIDLIDGLGGRVERLWPHVTPYPQLSRTPPAPASTGLLEGRDAQLDQALEAAAAGRAIEFAGPCGQGRSALLRWVAAEVGARLGRPRRLSPCR